MILLSCWKIKAKRTTVLVSRSIKRKFCKIKEEHQAEMCFLSAAVLCFMLCLPFHQHFLPMKYWQCCWGSVNLCIVRLEQKVWMAEVFRHLMHLMFESRTQHVSPHPHFPYLIKRASKSWNSESFIMIVIKAAEMFLFLGRKSLKDMSCLQNKKHQLSESKAQRYDSLKLQTFYAQRCQNHFHGQR